MQNNGLKQILENGYLIYNFVLTRKDSYDDDFHDNTNGDLDEAYDSLSEEEVKKFDAILTILSENYIIRNKYDELDSIRDDLEEYQELQNIIVEYLLDYIKRHILILLLQD